MSSFLPFMGRNLLTVSCFWLAAAIHRSIRGERDWVPSTKDGSTKGNANPPVQVQKLILDPCLSILRAPLLWLLTLSLMEAATSLDAELIACEQSGAAAAPVKSRAGRSFVTR